MDESVELDEIDLQYLEATRGPRLKSCKLHQLDREEELSPILWAELLKQDKLALREWIESQTVDLAAPLHELLRRLGCVPPFFAPGNDTHPVQPQHTREPPPTGHLQFAPRVLAPQTD